MTNATVYSWLDEDAVEGSYVPALDTLASHKQSLREDLLVGFENMEEVLLWQHALASATLGQVDGTWLSRVFANRWKLAALLADTDRRQEVTPHFPDDETARNERLRIVRDHLLPAFNDASVILRNRAGDYSDEGAVEDVDKQEFVAMRPRLHQRAVDQHAVLRWALGLGDRPLTTHEDLLLWVSELQDATDGYLPPDFADHVTARLGRWRPALINGDRASVWLLTQLADEILPVMNESLADAAERSNEKAKTPRLQPEVPQG